MEKSYGVHARHGFNFDQGSVEEPQISVFQTDQPIFGGAGSQETFVQLDPASAPVSASSTTSSPNSVLTIPVDTIEANKTYVPALIVTDFINGLTPTASKLESLASFALLQFNSYAAAGVADPSIGPYEALGLGLSGTTEFITKFGAKSDTSFIQDAFQEAFGRAAGDAQISHFQSQLDYFTNLYLGAGIDPSTARIDARGAVVGQILGFASTESGNAFAQAAQMFLLDKASGNGSYAVDLLKTYSVMEVGSPGAIVVANNLTTSFAALSTPVVFDISGAQFSSDFHVVVNGKDIPASSITISPDGAHLTVQGGLVQGQNDISLFASDKQGLDLFSQAVIWAGSQTLVVHAVDKFGNPIAGASLTATLTEDQDIKITAITGSDGSAVFKNLPNRDITLAGAQGGLFGSVGALGGDGTTQLQLLALSTPSSISNNDFSLNYDGWSVAGAPVSLIAHVESTTASTIASSPSTPSGRQIDTSHQSLADAAQATSATTNKDLVLTTSGEGPQTISRTFTIQPGAESVTLRYKFVSSEVPAGYLGSQYNDYYTVTLRDSTGNVISESASINGLGLAAFDASGSTAWRQLTIAVGQTGATVQADITVANVGDGAYDSKVIVDFVKESKLAIGSLQLNDIDHKALHFLSVSAANNHFDGHTHVNGTIAIQGGQDDSISSIVLDIISGGSVISHADLSDSARAILIGHNFGASGQLSISADSFLFDLSNAEAAPIPVAKDGSLLLRVHVTTASGEEVTKDYGSVDILTMYQGTNRYGGRDEDVGGDDWALPNTLKLINHYSSQLLIGDISNMNGGPFIGHQGHQTGHEFDGWYIGYNARDAAAATKMLTLLDDPQYGSDIEKVFVAYQKVDTDTFWTTIKTATLTDGRSAAAVILPDADHTSHFHWYVDV